VKQPRKRDASPPPGTRPPEYVVVTWVSEQLRDRLRHHGMSLAEALQTPGPRPGAPEPDLEAEP